MKFVSIREIRSNSTIFNKDLKKNRDIIVTNNGRPVAIISKIDEGNLEEQLAAFRRARAISAVESLQKASLKKGLEKISLKEINEEIQKVRKTPQK